VLTTDQKGAIAETAIIAAAIRLGVPVYLPIADGGRYDLIFDLDTRLFRVQCKWAPRHGEVIVVRCYSSRRTRTGLLRRCYEGGEIDAIAAYCPDVDRSYFLPFCLFGRRTEIRLRLGATQNNQRLGVNWAEQYEFAATLGADQGAVAQLGERVHGMHEVTGSSPVGST
jgi:hypothetical protein